MYDEVVRGVAAHLKARGFLKRGHRFGLRSDDNWGVIDFQKHHLATTRVSIQFVINFGVWLRSLEDESRDWAPSIADCHWMDRVGTEPPTGHWPPPREKWWIIDDESVPGFLPPIVSAAIEAVIPLLTEHLDDAKILSLYRTHNRNGAGFLRLGRRHRERLDRIDSNPT